MINEQHEYIDGGVNIQCQHCGTWCTVERRSAFFCDEKCKNAFHNMKRKRKKDIEVAFQSLETLINNMPLRGNSNEWDALSLMKKMINDAMWRVES